MLDIDKSKTAIEIREIFQNQYDGLSTRKGRKIVLSHCGVFSKDLVSSLSRNAEEQMISSGDNKQIVKRIFSILIEGLQNIRLHGERDELNRQFGFVVVSSSESEYQITMANLINSEEYQKVEKYLDKINNYSPTELKESYISILSNEFLSNKGGAGLGFITTRMKSGNPLRSSFYALKSGDMLFMFDVFVARKIIS